jgi:hypothetical protein
MTFIITVGRPEESLQVNVTVNSLYTGNTWSFTNPSCGLECGYLLGWYGTTTHSIGEGTGFYQIDISQDEEGLVRLICGD